MGTQISVQKAASLLGISEQRVRILCREGKISCTRIGRSWIVEEESLGHYCSETTTGMVEDHPLEYARKTNGQRPRPVALSFFSGAMGLDLGIEQAGFDIRLACEMDTACRKTIRRNRPGMALIGDINQYTAGEIREMAGLAPEDDIALVTGGPPCQAFSTAGRRKGFEDDRGNVFLRFVDLITELAPKYAVIENVRGLLSAPLRHRPHNLRGEGFGPLAPEEQKGGALHHILRKLRQAGYGVSFNLYNAANFGTPQKRERVVILCARDGTHLPFLEPTHSETGEYGLPTWRTFREVVWDIQGGPHTHVPFPEKRLKYYRLLGPGQYWRHLPLNLQEEALGASYHSTGGKTGFLRRLAWDAPSPTLVTHPAMPATDLAHPEELRPLSVEEYKRVQEFPDDWHMEGSVLEKYRQIGNAVPVGLGRAIGRHLMKAIEGRAFKEINSFRYSRYNGTDTQGWEAEFQATLSAERQLAEAG